MRRGNGESIPRMACTAGFSVVYKGAWAHAAAMPELGVNALDAAVQAYSNVAMLRQQINDKHRIYCTIKGSEGWSANGE
jgi:metal-dependent amidase/aminoacylase/carboxypeptidase family protein